LQTFDTALGRDNVPAGQRSYWRQWLTGYLAFCVKENAESKSEKTLAKYVAHLQEKKKLDWQCEQAKKAVQLYFRTTESNTETKPKLSPGTSKCTGRGHFKVYHPVRLGIYYSTSDLVFVSL
jgi:hypothetical protein